MYKAVAAFAKAEVPNVEPLDSKEVLSSKTLFCNKIQSQKVVADVSKKIALFTIKQMKDF
jgi:hypothetical protein